MLVDVLDSSLVAFAVSLSAVLEVVVGLAVVVEACTIKLIPVLSIKEVVDTNSELPVLEISLTEKVVIASTAAVEEAMLGIDELVEPATAAVEEAILEIDELVAPAIAAVEGAKLDSDEVAVSEAEEGLLEINELLAKAFEDELE